MKYLGLSLHREITNKEWAKSLLFIALYVLLILMGIPNLLKPYLPEIKAYKNYMPFILFLPLMILAAFFYGRDIIDSYRKFFRNFFKNSGIVCLFFIASMIILTMISTFTNITTTKNQDVINKFAHESNIIMLVLVVVFMAPIIEEIVFRHILIGLLSKQFGTPLMSLISLFLFAGMHVSRLEELSLYLPLTLSLIILYLIFNKSIAHSISFHILNNFFNVVIILSMK